MSSNVFETSEGDSAVNKANKIKRTKPISDSIDDIDDGLDKLINQFNDLHSDDDEDDDNDDDGLGNIINRNALDNYDEDDDDEGHLFLSSTEDDYDSNGELMEDDYDENYDLKDALRMAGNFKVRNKKKGNRSTASASSSTTTKSKSYWKRKMLRSTNRELDPEVRINLSLANEAFVRNDLQVAQNLYLEVIKKDPKNFNAYKTLGEIYKQQGKLNECCNCWLLAANIHPWDSQFWGNVGELSSQLGHIDQAIHCYSRAIQSDTNKSYRFVLERAILYKEKKQYGRALEGFQRVRLQFPTDSNIIKHLASVYVEQKRLNDAINLYMRILDNNINPNLNLNSKQKYPKFGWAELNILLELYIQQHSWRVGIKVIKLASRWLQNRENETWWDDNDDDAEFDEKKRFEVLDKLVTDESSEETRKKFYHLPIDIRYKIGNLRLGLNQKSIAMNHFDYLLEDEEDIADLFFEAGKVLEESGYHEEALTFLTRASLSDEFNTSTELINLLGKCFIEVGDYSQAKDAYETLLHHEPDNLDYKLALAEALFHLGDERAGRLIVEVYKKHPTGATTLEVDDIEIPNKDDENNNLSLIKNQKLIRSKSTKLSDQEKLEIENNAKRTVLEKYRRMIRLEESINQGDKVAVTAWMQLASQLVEMFMRVRSFFPRDKNRTFKGIVLYRRKKQMGIDEKLARMYNLYEGIVNDENYSRQFLTSKTEYRGLNYNEWFIIFIQYAIFLSKFDNNVDYGNEIIEVAMSVSVFVQDKQKEALLRILKLIIGIEKDEASTTITTFVRFFLIANQFSPFIYKFFICCYASGIRCWDTFTNYNHQKFFLRQLKAYDSIIQNKRLTGMATITADVKNFKLAREHPDLLYVYANLLGGSRSYVSSVVYLNRAYKEYNKDPMICLVLGLAHVHRSMQRLTNNRHIQLLQGISFILEYRDLREKDSTDYEIQEIEYNLGRLFHMLGLFSLAINHYNKVFKYHDTLEDTYDLSVDAAYNLTLIYNINGNSLLVRDLTEKYLTV
ncbi:RNA pol III initiation factor TFIIIC subunit [Scheffersomyces coipomensis]|uniref:RNA pol III initiation factor TFIIIC subunit n=1 Tax=Scheffersomyces coipomensis TaxID=1788519 RepID=UPI00315CE773